MGEINLGVFEVDIAYNTDDNMYEVYISHDGNSGEKYLVADTRDIGRLLTDEIDLIREAEAAEREN
jgi:hypothetical protein